MPQPRGIGVGWTDPEGARPFLGASLLGYYDPDRRLTYAGRVGTGINQAELERLWRTARRFEDAARRAAAALDPLRIAVGFKTRALGAARTYRRGQIPQLDGRQFHAPGRL
jgi:ATP-dependent DNA ligase